MAHGLARTGRDFDDLAEALADTYRIVCRDMIDRGLSQCARIPTTNTGSPFSPGFARIHRPARLCPHALGRHFNGGGAIGIVACATTLKGRISHLVYDQPEVPTLVLRGADSDLVLQETAEAMTRRGPHAGLRVPDCGHAPCMNVPEQIRVARDFLAR